MNNEQFDDILYKRISGIISVLGKKAEEYSRGGDRLGNFRRAAEFQRLPLEQVCWNFLMKHLVSLQDMIGDIAEGREGETAVWEEKIGDSINYLILLEAIVKEGRDG